MSSAGQGQLSKSQRKGLHQDRRNKIADGVGGKKEDDEITLVGEEDNAVKGEADAVRDLVEAAAVKTDIEAAGGDVLAAKVEKEVEEIKAVDGAASTKEVAS